MKNNIKNATWAEILWAAELLGVFGDDASDRANDFKSCALGEHVYDLTGKHLSNDIGDPQHFEEGWSEPKDYPLSKKAYDLGTAFADAIEINDVKEARKIYNKIHKLRKEKDIWSKNVEK